MKKAAVRFMFCALPALPVALFFGLFTGTVFGACIGFAIGFDFGLHVTKARPERGEHK